MSKIEKVHNFSILRAGGRSSLETNEQVVHGGKAKSVQYLKKQALKIKLRNLVVSPLLDYAKSIDSPNIQEYYASLRCSTILEQSQNKHLKATHRCGSRTCPICNNIRTAKIMDNVTKRIDDSKTWGKLVLTRSNKDLRGANAQQLRGTINDMYKTLSIIRQRVKRKFGSADVLISLEIEPEQYKRDKKHNFLYYGDYNPHFNLFGDYEVLSFVKEQWLNMVDCTEINQNLKQIEKEDINKTILEVVKYTTKGITQYKSGSFINLKALDNIITAMKGKRRIMMWGAFYNKAIKNIETADIDSLDLHKQVYYDIPVKDTGEFVDLLDSNNVLVTKVPSFSKNVTWVYNNETTNYHYLDEWGVNHSLLKWAKPPQEPGISFFIDKKTLQKWKYEKLQTMRS